MKESARNPLHQATSLILIAAYSFSGVNAEVIYKCVEGGRINFTSMPPSEKVNCQPFELKVIQPNPAEVARQLEQKRLSAMQARAEEARRQTERRKMEFEERLRRAGSAGEAMDPLRQSPNAAGGKWRSGSGRYPYYGPNPPERFIAPLPAQASKPAPVPPPGAGQNP